MNRDRQLKKDMESREVQIHEEYEKNRHLMSEDKVKEHQKRIGALRPLLKNDSLRANG